MKNISHIHDKVFKQTFGDMEIAADFLKTYLPEAVRDHVDMATLKPEKDSFVTRQLREVYSDLLLSAKINGEKGYLYFLFEHKSYPDKFAIFQMLKYIAEIWESKAKETNGDEVQAVIPLLIYNGKSKWNAKTDLRHLIKGFDEVPVSVKKAIPVYEYWMYDFSEMDMDSDQTSFMQTMLAGMRDAVHMNKEGHIKHIIKMTVKYEEVKHNIKYRHHIERIIEYVFYMSDGITEKDLEHITNQGAKEGSELIMTLAERLIQKGKAEGIAEGMAEGKAEGIKIGATQGMSKGIEIGKQEGKQEGILETSRKIVLNAVAMGMPKEDIMKMTGLTMEELEQIIPNVQNDL